MNFFIQRLLGMNKIFIHFKKKAKISKSVKKLKSVGYTFLNAIVIQIVHDSFLINNH